MAKKKTIKTTKAKVTTPEVVTSEVVTSEVVTPKVVTSKVVKPTLATAITTDITKPAKKPKTPKIDIIRGRMPLVLVFGIKFLEDGTIAEIASKYRTTVGKVDDIKKGANFGYVKETFKPTIDMIKAAVPRCKELEAGKEILKAIQEVGIATSEDEIAFDAIKVALRKKKEVKVESVKPASPVVDKTGADMTNELAELQKQTDINVDTLQKNKIDPVELAEEVEEEDKDLLDLLS